MKSVTEDQKEAKRLTLSLVCALALHVAFISGVHFTLPEIRQPSQHSMNISLLEQTGGLTRSLHETPHTPKPVPHAGAIGVPMPQPELLEPASPDGDRVEPKPLEAEPAVSPEPASLEPSVHATEPDISSAPEASSPHLATTVTNDAIETVVQEIEASDTPEPRLEEPTEESRSDDRPQNASLPSAIDLLKSGVQIARQNTLPLDQPSADRERFYNPKSMTTLEKFYIRSWVRKVEQVGTLNFPEEARRRNLTGSLTLDVTLRADGTIQRIRLLKSSGYEVLDQAAFKIVELAAPYAPFPHELQRQYDILHIRRTWQFLQGNQLLGR
jgi:protein TonB